MIRRKEDMRVQERANIRGGNGVIQTLHLLEPEEFAAKGTLCSIMTFEPGYSIGVHPHGPDGEIYYVLEGELEATEQGVTTVLRQGDVMFTTNGDTHSICNKTEAVARLLAIVIS